MSDKELKEALIRLGVLKQVVNTSKPKQIYNTEYTTALNTNLKEIQTMIKSGQQGGGGISNTYFPAGWN